MQLGSWLSRLQSNVSRQLSPSGRRIRRRRSVPISREIHELETRTLLAAVSWDGGGGDLNWSNAANWDTNLLPGSDDDVSIGAGFVGIVHYGGTHAVKSVVSASPFTQAGGTLTVSTTIDVSSSFNVSGGVLANATIQSGTTVYVTNGATLDGVVLNGDLDLTAHDNVQVELRNGLVLNGTAYVGSADGSQYGGIHFYETQTVSGTGEILFGGSVHNTLGIWASETTVTLGSDLTVHGAAGSLQIYYGSGGFVSNGAIASDGGGRIDLGGNTFVNHGIVSATGGSLLNFNASQWSSDGTIESMSGSTVVLGNTGSNSGVITADGGTVNLSGSWTNNGPITATTGSTVNFGGSWSNNSNATLTNSQLNIGTSGTWATGVLSADAGSVVRVLGVDVNGVGGLLMTGAGRYELQGGALRNTTLTFDPGNALHVTGGATLDGVVLNGDLDLTAHDNVQVELRNGLVLNGTAYVGSADGSQYGGIHFYETQTVSGTGEILFGGSVHNTLGIWASETTVTLGSDLTVHGAAGSLQIYYGSGGFVSNGAIASDGGGRIDLGGNTFVNHGIVSATGGSLLNFNASQWSSDGTIESMSGSTVVLGNTGSNSGVITADGGSVNLGGNWSNSGPITATSGSTVSFAGSWSNNSNATLTNSQLNIGTSGTCGQLVC